MKSLHILSAAALILSTVLPVYAADEPVPEYLRSAQSLVDRANAASSSLKQFTDEALIAVNYLRNAESEYRKNLSWSGKLKPEAEPAVMYLSEMARIQAAAVVSRSAKVEQELERLSLEKKAADLKSKIKVFDDKVAEIAALKSDVTNLKHQLSDRDSQITGLNAKVASLKAEISSKGSALSASDQKGSEMTKALEEQKKATSAAEQRASALSADLDAGRLRIAKLEADIASLSAQKGAEEQKVSAMSRANAFEAAVAVLGGVLKPGNDAVSAIIPRSQVFKISGKGATLAPDGDKLAQKIASIAATYPEYRVKIRVHGYGSPQKNEDPVATDIMARMFREAVVSKGRLDPSAVEALGVGPAEPAFPRSNVDGNRRVEVMFVKK